MNEAGRERLKAARASAEAISRGENPEGWAAGQDELGLALALLEDELELAERLEEAAACFRRALEIWSVEDRPEAWARSQVNLGLALRRRGELENRVEVLEAAAEALRAALEVLTPAEHVYEFAVANQGLVEVLARIRERSL